MNDLLNLAVEAHGGLKRWSQLTVVKASVSITGELWQLKAQSGVLDEGRDDPRSAFQSQRLETPWDDLHVAYFSSYALWNYLTIPFLYTYPGFVTEELATWQEDGEHWRALKVRFPDYIATHTRNQTSYFGPDGLLRRHQYTVDVLGKVVLQLWNRMRLGAITK